MNLSSTKLYPLLFLASMFVFAACSDDSDPNLTVKETIKVNNDLSELEKAFEITELDSILSEEGPITLFAPVDEVFPQDSLSGDELEATLKYLIVAMKLTYDNMQETESVVTLSGDSLFFSTENDIVTINGQTTISSEGIEASNGRVFIIEDTMEPYIIGTLTEIKKAQILVEEDPTVHRASKPGGEKMWLYISDETILFKKDVDGSLIKVNNLELEIGDEVKAVWEGPVLMSYPAHADAEKIVLLQ